MKIGRKVKKMFKVLGIVSVSACLFIGSVKGADVVRASINMNDPSDPMRVTDGDAFYAVDVSTSGTNTSNTHVVKLQAGDCVAVQVTVGSVSVGSIAFAIEQSLDNSSWGSITACQLVRLTDTLQTNATVGSTTGFWFAGEYLGTHTQYLATSTTYGSQSLGVNGNNGGNGTTTWHVLRSVSDWVRFRVAHTVSGTDTARYKIVLKKLSRSRF